MAKIILLQGGKPYAGGMVIMGNGALDVWESLSNESRREAWPRLHPETQKHLIMQMHARLFRLKRMTVPFYVFA